MTARFIASLLICWTGIFFCFLVAPSGSKTNPHVCEEIAQEINSAGLLSEDDARQIIDRCLENHS